MNTAAWTRYPSDHTDLQWDNIEHLLPRATGKIGRPREYPLRKVVNAILYSPPPNARTCPAGHHLDGVHLPRLP